MTLTRAHIAATPAARPHLLGAASCREYSPSNVF